MKVTVKHKDTEITIENDYKGDYPIQLLEKNSDVKRIDLAIELIQGICKEVKQLSGLNK